MQERVSFGTTVDSRPIVAMVYQASTDRKSTTRWMWILGGVHGDEVEGTWLAEWAEAYLSEFKLPANTGIVVVARCNPDGLALGTRQNARGIDLNRNLPTTDWSAEVTNPRYTPGPAPASEPETQALMKLWTQYRPERILSLHSFSKVQINVNGDAHAWAAALHAVCNYPITEDIGYPTPGCLGTWAGRERKVPTITLEIERGLARDKVLTLHGPCIEASVRDFSYPPEETTT